jgi:hypothetical protein
VDVRIVGTGVLEGEGVDVMVGFCAKVGLSVIKFSCCAVVSTGLLHATSRININPIKKVCRIFITN